MTIKAAIIFILPAIMIVGGGTFAYVQFYGVFPASIRPMLTVICMGIFLALWYSGTKATK